MNHFADAAGKPDNSDRVNKVEGEITGKHILKANSLTLCNMVKKAKNIAPLTGQDPCVETAVL